MHAKGRTVGWIFVSLVVIALALVGWLWFQSQQRVAEKEQKFQQLMSLTSLDKPVIQAPDFTLTDENGRPIRLSSFQGKVVVLTFMDPVCTDVCPIVSQELEGANQQLGTRSSDVVYVAVNVNQYHESQSDLQNFSKAHGLTGLKNWYFVTGSTASLQAVWKAYGINVIPNPDGDVQHSAVMYFINKDGQESYLANMTNSTANLKEWSDGIAYVIHQLV